MAANYYQNSGQTPNPNPSGKKSSGGNGWRVLLIAVLAILVISPIDFIPGDAATVVGLLDDVAYVVGIIGTVIGMIKKNKVVKTQSDGAVPEYHEYNEVDSNEKKK